MPSPTEIAAPHRFVGRAYELAQLRQFLAGDRPAIAVIYGRRRIGKSLLIEQALKDKSFLYFEGLEDRPKREQIAHFLFQLYRQLAHLEPTLEPPKTWKEALLLLFDAIKDSPCPVVLDEFQWMTNYRHAPISELKFVWDRFFAKLKGQKLILCGSIASFMIDKVMQSSALYGRIDVEMNLPGFSLKESSELLQGRGQAEVLEAQLLTGGVPRYLELIGEQPSVQLAMQNLAFTPNKYFVNEYHRIFSSHFGKNADFESLVRTLAEHPLGLRREELAQKANVVAGGPLTKRLRDLEAAAFISSTPSVDKPQSSYRRRFFLSDAYLRFYFSFIKPNLDKIQARKRDLFLTIARSGAFHAWMGRSFEYTCLQHANVISEILGFSGIDFTAGPYFAVSKKSVTAGVQVDLVFDRADDVMTICEMKYSRQTVGVEVISEMERKMQLLEPIAGKKTLQPILLVKDKPSTELVNRGYFHRIITADELFR